MRRNKIHYLSASERKTQIVAYIRRYQTAFSVSPTVSEIAKGIGVTTQSIYVYLREMESECRITRNGETRGIQVVEKLE